MATAKTPIGPISDEFDLLERHIKILKTTRDNQPIGLIRLSEMTGIPKHKVRYSLKLLEQQGIILATQEGATVTDGYDDFMREVSEYLEGLHTRIEKLLERL